MQITFKTFSKSSFTTSPSSRTGRINLFVLIFALLYLLSPHQANAQTSAQTATQAAGPEISQASAEAVDWEAALKKMYQRFPTSRMLTDPQRLVESMKAVDAKAANELKNFISHQPNAYDNAREYALKQAGHQLANRGRVVISGGSGSGAALARVYAEAGYQVDLYEARANPTREVQWGARQELMGAMRHYYGSRISQQFDKQVASRIGETYKHIDGEHQTHSYPLPTQTAPSSAALAGRMTGQNIVSSSSVAAVRVADVEALVRKECSSDPRIHMHLGTPTPELVTGVGGSYTLKDEPEIPKYIVVAEGAGSKTAKAIGIERTAMSPERLQVAGIIHDDIAGGNAVGATQRFAGSDYTIVSGSLHREGSGKIWFVTDLDPSLVKPSSQFVEGTPEFTKEKSRLIEEQYRKIAAKTLGIDPAKMATLKVSGATGGALQPFNMQLGLSRTAVKGNVILVGDAVGNGHWAAGAGGMIGMTAHPDRVANYLNDIERGVSPSIAKLELNKRLLEDSRTWIRAAIDKMYPDAIPVVVQAAFDRAIAKHPTGGSDFKETFEKEIRRVAAETGAAERHPNAEASTLAHGAQKESTSANRTNLQQKIAPDAATTSVARAQTSAVPERTTPSTETLPASNSRCLENALKSLIANGSAH